MNKVRCRRWLLFIVFGLQMCSLRASPLQTIAHYGFEGGVNDSTGRQQPFVLEKPGLVDQGSLCTKELLWLAETPVLEDFDYRSFTVALDFLISEFDPFSGNILSGGPSYRWFSLDTYSGLLTVCFSLKDSSRCVPLPAAPLTTNKWYKVAASVDLAAGTIRVHLDGKTVGVIRCGAGAEFNVTGTAYETTDRVFSLRNYGNASILRGCIDNLQVYNRAANEEELRELVGPHLDIRLQDGIVMVVASAAHMGYRLESSKVGSIPGGWVRLAQSPAIICDSQVWVLPLAGPGQLFRLVRPADGD